MVRIASFLLNSYGKKILFERHKRTGAKHYIDLVLSEQQKHVQLNLSEIYKTYWNPIVSYLNPFLNWFEVIPVQLVKLPT